MATTNKWIRVELNGVELPPGSIKGLTLQTRTPAEMAKAHEIMAEIERLQRASFTVSKTFDRFAEIEYEDGRREFVAYNSADGLPDVST